MVFEDQIWFLVLRKEFMMSGPFMVNHKENQNLLSKYVHKSTIYFAWLVHVDINTEELIRSA